MGSPKLSLQEEAVGSQESGGTLNTSIALERCRRLPCPTKEEPTSYRRTS